MYAINKWQISEHYVLYVSNRLYSQQTSNDQYDGDVQTDDAEKVKYASVSKKCNLKKKTTNNSLAKTGGGPLWAALPIGADQIKPKICFHAVHQAQLKI